MKLRYINVVLNKEIGDIPFGVRFNYNVFFIDYFLSKQIRKINYVTDGTFRQIIIKFGQARPGIDLCNDAIFVEVPFEIEAYSKMTQTERCNYCVALVKQGLGIVQQYKAIPYDELIRLCDELVAQNFTIRWNFRNLRVPEYNLRVSFNCKLDTNDFVLSVSASNLKTKTILCEGQVARTFPYCDDFTWISKKMRVDDGQIIIPNKLDKDIISIDLEGLAKGELYVVFLPAPAGYSRERIELWNEFQGWLQYDNNDFKH